MWSGLGYYSRGKRLHEGAKKVVEKFSGVLPSDPAVLEKEIPGIGKYTAGAICSIAFNKVTPLVDGNVVRVLSRLRSIGGDPKAKPSIALHWKLAQDTVDDTKPGDFNQAMMELGATVCTPAKPSCSTCPLKDNCRAFAEVSFKNKIKNNNNKKTNQNNNE